MLKQPLVAVVMGSRSDWDTMSACIDLCKTLSIPYHTQVISAHRTPNLLYQFAEDAESAGFEIIIAAAGGAAHLPGMLAAKTLLPVIGVPIQTGALNGLDSLLSIVQMPAGIPVGTVAIGAAGAKNAALLAAAILARRYPKIHQQLEKFRAELSQSVLDNTNLEDSP